MPRKEARERIDDDLRSVRGGVAAGVDEQRLVRGDRRRELTRVRSEARDRDRPVHGEKSQAFDDALRDRHDAGGPSEREPLHRAEHRDHEGRDGLQLRGIRPDVGRIVDVGDPSERADHADHDPGGGRRLHQDHIGAPGEQQAEGQRDVEAQIGDVPADIAVGVPDDGERAHAFAAGLLDRPARRRRGDHVDVVALGEQLVRDGTQVDRRGCGFRPVDAGHDRDAHLTSPGSRAEACRGRTSRRAGAARTPVRSLRERGSARGDRRCRGGRARESRW